MPDDLQGLLSSLIQEMMPPDLREKGWRYIDPPGIMSPEAWDYFIDWIGEGEYKCIAHSSGIQDGQPFKRGQFFISPTGMKNLADLERGLKLKEKHFIVK